MKRQILGLLRLASVGFFVALSPAAFAQEPGSVTNHAFAIGKGPGVSGYTSLLCGAGQIAIGASTDPVCTSLGANVQSAIGIALNGTGGLVGFGGNIGAATGTSLALGGASIGSNGLAVTGSADIVSASTTAFVVGQTSGTGNAAFQVNASAVSLAAGIAVGGNPAGSGAALSVTSSATNESGFFNAKGSGALGIGNVSTGAITLGSGGGGVTIGSTLTYGGVTLSSAPTGTGAMVLGTGPSIAGGALSGTFSGTPTFSGANFVTLGNIVKDATAWSLLGNATSGTANYAPITIGGLVQKASPASTDLLLLQDQAASGALKFATVAAIASAGSVGSFNGLTGAVTTNMVVQPFTAGAGTYTYTPTTGMLHAVMECVGSGAGGGSAAGISGGTFGGGGGGSGSYSRKTVTAAQVGATATIVIGAPGAGGASGSNNGANGSAVTITSAASVLLLQANGGNGGKFGSSVSATSGVAGAGAASGTGDIIAQGSPGGHGIYANNTTTLFPSGDGASSAWGGGALGVSGAGVATAGTNAGNYGGGGSGGEAQATTSNAAGGNGSAGACFITDFVNL